MNVPFCLPLIDDDVVKEVHDCLTNTGWLTTGPKVLLLQKEISKLTGIDNILCVNSWTSGAMLVLKWYGIGQGDEVIIPAYTYSATALCAMNLGANVVMVDVNDDFNINVENIKNAITSKTKAILPVDIGGWPCDYDEIMEVVNSTQVRSIFNSNNDYQNKIGRPIVLSDSAHSIGARYKGKSAAHYGDFTIFSLHSVKNVTSGEGGAICINLPTLMDNSEQYAVLKNLALNGQTKSAFEKNKVGAWRYDIVDQGLKINMPDICASIALAQIRKYSSEMLPERKEIFNRYSKAFSNYDWAILPKLRDNRKESACHLYNIRFKDVTEDERDEMIDFISQHKIGVNVHYIPMAMLTLFKNRGYDIADYPVTYSMYQNEITLPLYNNLTLNQIDYVIATVIKAYQNVKNKSI